jgi:hypothetical protein
MAVPAATPCTTRAITRDVTPSAVQKIAVLTAAMARAATRTGRRPRWSLSDPSVISAARSPRMYTAKITVSMVTEKSQRSRYSGQIGDGALPVAVMVRTAADSTVKAAPRRRRAPARLPPTRFIGFSRTVR